MLMELKKDLVEVVKGSGQSQPPNLSSNSISGVPQAITLQHGAYQCSLLMAITQSTNTGGRGLQPLKLRL